MPEQAGDDRRRAGLVSARRRATLLLAGVTGVFVATLFMGDAAWVGFLRATAEAAMVGGIADWFAVVALFRHPLGLPIPHTAVIPRSKDGLGANLATFVADNFLDPDDLADRLESADLAARAGTWLATGDNASGAARRLAEVVVTFVDDLDADRVGAGFVDAAVSTLDRRATVQLAGRGLEAAITDGHHNEVLTTALLGVRAAIADNEAVLRRRLYEESPRWVPPALDDIVFDRAAAGLTSFLTEVARDVDHPLRHVMYTRLQDLATALQSDEAAADSLRQRLRGLADNPVVAAWASQTWEDVAASLRTSAQDPDSRLRRILQQRLEELADRLQHDEAVRASINEWVAAAAPAVAQESRSEIASLVAATVDRWDPDETSDRLELWLGRDLQFVRINGTVVGGLVGLVLHTITVLAG